MNREEAKKEVPLSVFTAYELQFEQYASDALEQFDKLLDKIYNDFEKEIDNMLAFLDKESFLYNDCKVVEYRNIHTNCKYIKNIVKNRK